MKKEVNTTTSNEAAEVMQEATENVLDRVSPLAIEELLFNALSKIEDKEDQKQYLVICQKYNLFPYLQSAYESAYELADQIEDDDKVVALVDSIEKPSEYNTQCGIHRQSVVMCRIVEDLGKEDDDKVVALVDSIEKPSEYFTPNKVL